MGIIEAHGVIPFFRNGLGGLTYKSDVWGTDLVLNKGESVMVKAASGSGKTTFCSYIAGMRRDFDGQIMIDGKNLKTMSSGELLLLRRNTVSTLFQNLALFDDLNAVDNVLVKSALNSFCSIDQVKTMLCEMGLDEEKLVRPVYTLSLGQKQKVAFVRMLCSKADVRILDEPVSHLDPESAEKMSSMLKKSQAVDGATIIVTSVGHDFNYSYDRVLRL